MRLGKRGRRTFLLGSAGVLALPFLESLVPSAIAGPTATPKRLVILVHHQGSVLECGDVGQTEQDAWTPTGTGTSFTLSPILSPLEPWKSKIAVLSGMWNSGGAHSHESVQGILTASLPCCPLEYLDMTPETGSIDQIIADHIAVDTPLPHRALNLGVGYGSGLLGPLGDVIYDANLNAVEEKVDPFELHDELFSQLAPPPTTPTTLQRLRMQRKSVLDFVLDDLDRLTARLSAADRIRLEHHADAVRKLEQQIGAMGQQLAECGVPPIQMDTPWAESDIDVRRLIEDQTSAEMIRQSAMALACDLTRVVTIHYTNAQDPKFPWLGIDASYNGEDWHGMVHNLKTDPGARPHLIEGFKWYNTELGRMLGELDAFDEGSGTLLDNSLVLMTTEFGDGNDHTSSHMPVVIAGGLGGAIPMGRHHHYSGAPERGNWEADPFQGTRLGQLYTTIQNLFGIPGNWANRAEYDALDLG